MQLCAIHAERFGFRARNPGPKWESPDVETEAELGRCVVALLAVEVPDTRNQASVVSIAADTLSAVTEQLNTESVVLVPCPQLSDEPAPATQAAAVFETLASELELRVDRVPLGWDVAYDLKTKAHPYSIQAFGIDAARDFETEWFVSTRSGSVSPASEHSIDDAVKIMLDLKRAESATTDATQTTRSSSEASSPAIPDAISTGAAMGLWQLGDRHLSLLPLGVVVRELLFEWFANECVADGALPVSAGYPEPSDAKSALTAFGGASVRRADLPIRIFDPRGDTVGQTADSTWLQVSTAPERVSIVADESAALAETCQQGAFVHGVLCEFDLEYQPVITVTDSFRSQNAEWIAGLGSNFDQNVLVGCRPEQSTEVQIEFVVLDEDGRRLATPTVVLDTGLPDRLEIELSGTSESTPPVAVRSSPLSGLESFVAAILEGRESPQPPLPVWLAPTQLRLIPIDDKRHRSRCEELAAQFEEADVRVDIDDREIPVHERLTATRGAGVPYDAVVGDDELDGHPLDVSIFAGSDHRSYTPEALSQRIVNETAGYPTTSWGPPRRLRDVPARLQNGS